MLNRRQISLFATLVAQTLPDSLFLFQVVRSVGPLEWVMNTPSHHRVHHARNREAIDRNYAGVLIIWDRMFGTFEPERPARSGPTNYTHPIRTLDPFEIQVRFCMYARAWVSPSSQTDNEEHSFKPHNYFLILCLFSCSILKAHN